MAERASRMDVNGCGWVMPCWMLPCSANVCAHPSIHPSIHPCMHPSNVGCPPCPRTAWASPPSLSPSHPSSFAQSTAECDIAAAKREGVRSPSVHSLPASPPANCRPPRSLSPQSWARANRSRRGSSAAPPIHDRSRSDGSSASHPRASHNRSRQRQKQKQRQSQARCPRG